MYSQVWKKSREKEVEGESTPEETGNERRNENWQLEYLRKGERIAEENGRKEDRSDGSTNNHEDDSTKERKWVLKGEKRSELQRKKRKEETVLKEGTNVCAE